MNDHPPRARTTDPDTSHDAAASVRNTTTLRQHVLRVLIDLGPLTDEEIVHYCGWRGSPSGIRTRRNELVEDALVTRHETDGRTSSGRRAARWWAPNGQQQSLLTDHANDRVAASQVSQP